MVDVAANSMNEDKKQIAAMKAKQASFKRRKDSINKKTMELSVLCGIKVCAIIIEPNGDVETWPQNSGDVLEVIKIYKDFSDQNRCNNKRVTETEQEIVKNFSDQNFSNKNRVLEIGKEIEVPVPNLLHEWDIESSSETSLQDLLKRIEVKIDAVTKRIDFLNMDRVNDQSKNGDGTQPMGKEGLAVCDGEEASKLDYQNFDDLMMMKNWNSYEDQTLMLQSNWDSDLWNWNKYMGKEAVYIHDDKE